MDDIDRLRDLYTDRAPVLVRVITRMTRDPAAAEDIVQEAFLRLTRELADGRRPDNPDAWVAQVARHLAISRYRRAAAAARLAPRLLTSEVAGDPSAAILEGERAMAVQRALALLPPVERTAVVLAATGMPGPEIAAQLGRTPLATRALLYRARRRMRPELLALADPR
ncbi:MAG TPA: sigma-70 family RNA polymerase sigma factor [Candidatus Limnocylindrales bacterium]|jgi:RNA polymerase sigma-70 factor (ECF subfamily)|nr:sigma-70 family RNA polymerase sigma factor [Candidatus Limnocylindrales bacterium]